MREMLPSFLTPCLPKYLHQRHSLSLNQRQQSTGRGSLTIFSRLGLPRPSVVFVTPDNFSKDIDRAIYLSESCIRAQVALIQIRDRKGTKDDVERVVDALLSSDIPPNRLVLNGIAPADVAKMDKGLGIHIKEKDIPEYLPGARAILGADPLIGCAVHSPETAQKAAEFEMPDYFQVGTMFATMSHPGKIPEGPGLLRKIRNVVGEEPLLIGIGGIEQGNVANIIKNDGDGVAVVTLIAGAENPEETASSLFQRCKAAYDSVTVN